MASDAQAGGDHILTARVLLFMTYWSSMDGKRTTADYFDMLIEGAPSYTRSQITATAVESLRRLPAETVLAPTARDAPNAGQLLAIAERVEL